MRQPEQYYWISFTSQSFQIEVDQCNLMELGALGTEEGELPERLEDSETPVSIRGFFVDVQLWQGALAAFSGKPDLLSGETPWEDWDRSWRERQLPVWVTSELSVCPPWVMPPNSQHCILLEAKMAFGTGTHETTRIASMLLEKTNLRDNVLLDVGCGTGILSLYAAKRGAKWAIGFDIDPVTGPNLHENLELNRIPIGTKVGFFVGTMEAFDPAFQFDTIVCNMVRTEAWPYLEQFRSFLKPGGLLHLSGQRLEDKPHWHSWFLELKIEPTNEITLGEWWGFTVLPNFR